MNIKQRLLRMIMLVAGTVIMANTSQAAPSQGQVESRAQRDARMSWWHEAKFGMFIHWGLYSLPAGKLTVTLSDKAPDSIASVLCLEMDAGVR